jgi:hypothetical protein
MHKSRIETLVVTVLTVAMTFVFILRAWREPDLARMSLCFAPVFACLSGMGAIAVLLPNSWYRHRERLMKRNDHAA